MNRSKILPLPSPPEAGREAFHQYEIAISLESDLVRSFLPKSAIKESFSSIYTAAEGISRRIECVEVSCAATMESIGGNIGLLAGA